MENLLLSAHVLAGILFVGPVAVTTSLFPRFAPVSAGASAGASAAPGSPGTAVRNERSASVARMLHGVTRVYGVLALVVPVLGLVLAAVQGRLGEVWIIVAMVLTAVAGGLLALRIAPAQRAVLEVPGDAARLRGLSMLTGVFNLLWAAVVVLMVVRPGSV
ncbi:membrane protein [Promicromonospora sukumoe]|uniref:membrane protein n=1 Tax=Promicromonospora sukumoe TaxID=88382 RepID=UPI00047844CF|nr:membrane protein [Promicromonospora sukumoe]